jgi:predicted dehydrogenase
MISFSESIRQTGQTDVLELACRPIPLVRIAFIGLGKRGKEAFNNFMYIEGVQVVAVCDLFLENLSEVRQILHKHDKQNVVEYTQPDDWRVICERSDIDLIYICTHRNLHTPIAVYAMQCGKHVAIEVPAANTIEECWQLVDTAETTRRHCMMLENCCYDAFELAVQNMVQQGLFGEIFHVEGAYIHDLRTLDFDQKSHYLDVWSMQGNPYPTHGLGPLCQLLNIHRGDKLAWLTSVSSGQFGFPAHSDFEVDSNKQLGNINTTIIRTEKDKTIVLQHDISSPRPYSRNYLVSGTEGFAQKRTTPEIAFSSNPNEILSKEATDDLLTKYEQPFYQEMGELARKVGCHGGMDFIMDYRLIYCLRNGLPLDMDVYDAAEWSSIVELSAISVTNGSTPVEIPDFTRGACSR